MYKTSFTSHTHGPQKKQNDAMMHLLILKLYLIVRGPAIFNINSTKAVMDKESSKQIIYGKHQVPKEYYEMELETEKLRKFRE
jgi:hypothetical protein